MCSICVCLCVCYVLYVVYAYVAHAHECEIHVCGGKNRMLGVSVFLFLRLPYRFQTGSAPELEAHCPSFMILPLSSLVLE